MDASDVLLKDRETASIVADKNRIAELEAALRKIADMDFEGPSRLWGADAASIAQDALDGVVQPEPKRTYSICPKTETGLHDWERMPPPTRSSLGAGTVMQDMHVLPMADMKCSQCGKLYSEHVHVETP